jgi:hypothetical protein
MALLMQPDDTSAGLDGLAAWRAWAGLAALRTLRLDGV